jgi:hypothetical protein
VTTFPDNYAYYGAADAGSLSSDFNAIRFVVDQALAEMSTATVVQVMTAPYDAEGNPIPPGSAAKIGYIDVKPMISMTDGYGNVVEHGTVYHLSYHRYQGGNGAFISDPVVGDQGKMVFADRDTSVVRATGQVSAPGSRRKFDKSDGTYFGQTQAGAPSQFWTFLPKGSQYQDLYGNTWLATAQGIVINGALINQQGDIITKHGTSLDHHVNTNVTTGTADTGPPP